MKGIEGMAEKVWGSDYVQFPRLLSEILGMGLSEEQRNLLCKSMDLEGLELEEILVRADRKWERIKAAYKKQERGHGRRKKVVRSI